MPQAPGRQRLPRCPNRRFAIAGTAGHLDTKGYPRARASNANPGSAAAEATVACPWRRRDAPPQYRPQSPDRARRSPAAVSAKSVTTTIRDARLAIVSSAGSSASRYSRCRLTNATPPTDRSGASRDNATLRLWSFLWSRPAGPDQPHARAFPSDSRAAPCLDAPGRRTQIGHRSRDGGKCGAEGKRQTHQWAMDIKWRQRVATTSIVKGLPCARRSMASKTVRQFQDDLSGLCRHHRQVTHELDAVAKSLLGMNRMFLPVESSPRHCGCENPRETSSVAPRQRHS